MAQEDLSVPKEFEEHSKKLFAKESITEREFVDLCSLAVKFSESHWEKRMGLAYTVVCFWHHVEHNNQLDEIAGEFASLEIPDVHVQGDVRQKWQHVKKLILQADKDFPKTIA